MLNPHTKFLTIALGTVVAACLALSIHPSRTAARPDGSNSEKLRAANLVLLVNTAEVLDCRWKSGSVDTGKPFLSWDDLLKSACFKRAERQVAVGPSDNTWAEVSFSREPEVVPGLVLRLVVSADGKHYEVLVGKQGDPCGFAFFSDERGPIFEGKVFACDLTPHPGVAERRGSEVP